MVDKSKTWRFYRGETMKVLHLLNSNIFSGAERVAINLIKASRPEVEAVYCSPYGSIKDVLEKNNIKYLKLNRFNYKNLDKVLNEYNPDIIHAHDFKSSLLASRFSKQYKIISHIHQDPKWFKKVNLQTITYLIASNSIDKIIFVSKHTYSDFKFKKLISKKVAVIHNAIDIQKIISLSKEFQPTNFDLIYVGRFEDAKNPLEFVDLVHELKKKNKAIVAAMVGSGSLVTSISKKISKLELQNNITLTGFADNPYKYMAHSKICVIPSKNEGFSLAAIEAGVIGIPVVGNNVGGLGEVLDIIGAPKTNSFDELADKCSFLLKNLSYRKALSEKESKASQLNFSLIQLKTEIVSIYKEIAEW